MYVVNAIQLRSDESYLNHADSVVLSLVSSFTFVADVRTPSSYYRR